jgi:hypothetical protein
MLWEVVHFSIGCNFENALVTRFLSIRAELKMGSA